MKRVNKNKIWPVPVCKAISTNFFLQTFMLKLKVGFYDNETPHTNLESWVLFCTCALILNIIE